MIKFFTLLVVFACATSARAGNRMIPNLLYPFRDTAEVAHVVGNSLVDSLQTRYKSLQSAMDALLPIRQSLAKGLSQEHGKYHTFPFAKIEKQKCDSLITLANALMLPEMDNFAIALKETVSHKAEYDSLSLFMQTPPDDSDVINVAKSRVDSLRLLCSTAQQVELDALKIAMEIYPKANVVTKDIVVWINDTMGMYRPGGNPKGALSTLGVLLDNVRSDIDNYVNKVPYLKNLFERMLEELHENPLVESEAEKILINLK